MKQKKLRMQQCQLPSFIHLTPRQSCSLHGWLQPKRTLHWDDVCSSDSQITLPRCLQCGLTPQQLKEMQPDVGMWIDFKGVSFNDVEMMLEWPLHPIRDLKGNLSDLARMHYPPRVLARLGITYEYLRGVLNMDDSWMQVHMPWFLFGCLCVCVCVCDILP